jgi:esterase/lipase
VKLRIAIALIAILVLVGWWSTPPGLDSAGDVPDLPRDLDSWLRDREATVDERFGIVPGTEKRIKWRGQPGVRTEYAVVYLHGFSATRAEIAPVPERIAASLNANLFESRLAGHGRETERLESVAAEAWLEDGLEALAIGAAIGRKVVLLGTSTGATLAIAVADHELFQAVDSLVLVSPNLGFDDPAADWLTRPYGPLIARATIGEYREFEPANDDQARYWTTRYPTAALIEMLRLVELANANLEVARVPRALLVYSSKDVVVSPTKYLDAFQRLPAASKERHEVIETSDPAFHVLTGDILSPVSVTPTVDRIVAFVRGEASLAEAALPPEH